jgi:hypothetical protein
MGGGSRRWLGAVGRRIGVRLPPRMFHQTTPSTPDLLAEWRWLLGGRLRLIGWSSAGDLFYIDEAARICRLDTGAAEIEVVADSGIAFNSLSEDSEQADDVFLLPVVRSFESIHGALPEGHCLGFRMLPVLGGTYTIENRHAISIAEHASLTGYLHRQIRDLPDGTAIRLKVVP